MPSDETLLHRIDLRVNEAISAFHSGEAEHRFVLDDLALRIRLTGPSWAGVVDKPVARFLVELDEMLSRELRAAGIDIPDSDHGLVALQIQDGSLDAVLKYAKETLREFAKLKPYQQILIVCTILGAMGLLNSDKIIHSLNEASLARISAGAQEALARERVDLVAEIGKIKAREPQLQAPVRRLVKKMGPEDRIQMPGRTEGLRKEEAKEVLTKSGRSKAEQFYVDHPYKVESLNTKDPDRWRISLSFGDVSFSADVLLNKNEMANLLKDFQEAHAKNSAIAPSMQVTANVSENGITSAKVVGLGEPRKGAKRLSEALADAKLETSED